MLSSCDDLAPLAIFCQTLRAQPQALQEVDLVKQLWGHSEVSYCKVKKAVVGDFWYGYENWTDSLKCGPAFFFTVYFMYVYLYM